MTPTKAFLVPVVFLAVAEAACRLFFSDGFTGRFDYGYLPSAGFEVTADTVELRRTGGRRFYPQSFSRGKPPDRLRVFAIGDSVTRGDGLDSAYPKALQRVLKSRGHDAEVLNLGLTAYGSTRKQIVARQVLQFDPDLIVLHVNEANEGFDERDRERAESYRSWHPRNWFLKSYALHRLYELRTDSLFWRYLPEEIRSLRSVRTPDAALSAALDDPAMHERWLEHTRRKTAETVREITAAGVPVVLVSVTYWDKRRQVLDDFGLERFVESLESPQVAAVSSRRLFLDSDPKAVFTDGMHLTAQGHRMLAERLADAALGLLRRGDQPDSHGASAAETSASGT